MARPPRLLMYAPRLHAGVRLAHVLRQLADTTDRVAFSVCARQDATRPYPAGCFYPLPASSDLAADFATLTGPGCDPFDVLLLPDAWQSIPPGNAGLLPAPCIACIPHFDSLHTENGALTDRAWEDLLRVRQAAAAFVFPSTELMREAITHYDFPEERCCVIQPANAPSLDEAEEFLRLVHHLAGASWQVRPHARTRHIVSREERVAWLIDHPALGDAEVRLIRSFGYEVYAHKFADEHTSLPVWATETLARHDFSTGLTLELLEILHGYFGTVVCEGYSALAEDLVKSFNGRVVMRTFGRCASGTISDHLLRHASEPFWTRLRHIQDRFWLAPIDEAHLSGERPLFRQRSVVLPLVLPSHLHRQRETWTGTDRRILVLEESDRVSAAFGDLPFFVPHEGASSRHFTTCRVVFHESTAIDFRPLEAMAHGVPVVFVRGGLLARCGADQPGACDTLAEARQKLLRILAGDDALVAAIRAAQRLLLASFDRDACREAWHQNFVDQIGRTRLAPDVLAWPEWQTPTTPTPPPSHIDVTQPIPGGRLRVGIDMRVYQTGGIFKFSTHLIRAMLDATSARHWGFDLRLMPLNDHLEPPQWTGPRPEHLSIQMGDGRATRAGLVERVCHTADTSGSRLRRAVAKVAACGLLYARGVRRQGTLLPRNTDALRYCPQKILRLPGVRSLVARRPQPVQPTEPTFPRDALLDGLAPPTLVELPQQNDPPPLDLAGLDALLAGCDVLLVTNPFRRLSPNIPLDEVRERPVAIILYDLAHEYTDSWGPLTMSVRREMRLWSRLARVILFCSEFVRQEAIRRYQIPPEKTRVIHMPPFLDEAAARTGGSVQARYGLPERYLLNLSWQASHKNNLVLLEAMRELKWRGFPTSPLVLAGKEARSFLLGEVAGAYFQAFRRVLRRSGLVVGQDLYVVDYIHEEDVPALVGQADACLTVSRSEASLNGLIMEAMHYGAPLVASALPQVTERLGTDDRYALLVPPDDPVAVADAIQELLTQPEQTQARVRRAGEFIRSHSWQATAEQYLEALATAAGVTSATRRRAA